MQLDWLTQLYDYGRWANGRILDTCEALTPAAFTAPGEVGYGSIRDTLVHSAWAGWIWLSRWQGDSPRERWAASDIGDVAALRARWETVAAEMASFIAGLTEADLSRVIAYTSASAGEQRAQPLWEMLLHQAMHAGQHRAEAAYFLTQAGRSPGDLDMLVYQLHRPRSAGT